MRQERQSLKLSAGGYTRTEIKCPNCKHKGKAKKARSSGLLWLLFFLGFFTAGITWVIAILYAVLARSLKCPICGNKNVIKIKLQKQFKKERKEVVDRSFKNNGL